jgi:hypothetical protein
MSGENIAFDVKDVDVENTNTDDISNSDANTNTPNYSQQLSNVEITDENVALNVLVSFLNLAQKRGAFALDESAKIWECIQKFVKR